MFHNHRHIHNHPRGLRLAVWILFGVAAAAGFALLFAVLVRYLWNWLMPELFDLAMIDYWQAFGLVLLARLLVGGWHHGSGRDNRHLASRCDREKNKLPDEIRENWGKYLEYWKVKGKEDFTGFLSDHDREEENGK